MTVQEEEKQEEAMPVETTNSKGEPEVEVAAETPAENADAEKETAEKGDEESPLKDDEGKGEGDDAEPQKKERVSPDAPWGDRMWEVFTTFWPLGLVRGYCM